jgi:hypothetical protein
MTLFVDGWQVSERKGGLEGLNVWWKDGRLQVDSKREQDTVQEE